MYLIFDYWNAFFREPWERDLSRTAFLAVTIVFFAVVIIFFVFIIQPLIYGAIKGEIEAMDAGTTEASSRLGRKGMVGSDTLTADHDVLIGFGTVLGLFSGYLLSNKL